jgi:hypothetical protein
MERCKAGKCKACGCDIGEAMPGGFDVSNILQPPVAQRLSAAGSPKLGVGLTSAMALHLWSAYADC